MQLLLSDPIQAVAASKVRNQIICGLPAGERTVLLRLLRAVTFPPGVRVTERSIGDCLFIEGGVVSLLCEPYGMRPVEVGLVGPEGMLGVAAVLGAPARIHFAQTVTACEAWAVDAAELQVVCAQSPRLLDALLLYSHTRLAQTMKRSACHLQHRLEQRLADWILAATDRLGAPRISITHRQLSDLLGATRPGVTLAIQELEGHHGIRAKRNLITVRSRAALSDIACGCHGGHAAPADESRRVAADEKIALRLS